MLCGMSTQTPQWLRRDRATRANPVINQNQRIEETYQRVIPKPPFIGVFRGEEVETFHFPTIRLSKSSPRQNHVRRDVNSQQHRQQTDHNPSNVGSSSRIHRFWFAQREEHPSPPLPRRTTVNNRLFYCANPRCERRKACPKGLGVHAMDDVNRSLTCWNTDHEQEQNPKRNDGQQNCCKCDYSAKIHSQFCPPK
jgi:hypothetical protein